MKEYNFFFESGLFLFLGKGLKDNPQKQRFCCITISTSLIDWSELSLFIFCSFTRYYVE